MNQNDYETGFSRDERFILNKFREKELDIIMKNNQPERSKREDRCPPLTSSMTASQYNQFMNDASEYMRNGCGALNTQETE